MDNSAFVENLQSVWGNDPSYVWAVGDGASIVRWNGMAWVSVPTDGMGGWLFGVWGSPDMQDPQSVWAVGQDISMMGKILKVQQHP